ncbi:hypothetical protein D3C73_1532530 [compost metagenome]
MSPELMPLPNPISRATKSNGTNPAVKGIRINAVPMMSVEGMATHCRPFLSISFPAG